MSACLLRFLIGLAQSPSFTVVLLLVLLSLLCGVLGKLWRENGRLHAKIEEFLNARNEAERLAITRLLASGAPPAPPGPPPEPPAQPPDPRTPDP